METNKKIGVFLCRCGGNISQVVDIDRLREFAEKQQDVVFADYQSFTCSSEGQATIQKTIKEQGLDSVVIGCCTPKQYEDLFRESIKETGLNPYLLEMVNLREQCSYPHYYEPEKATQKGIKLLEAGVDKVRLLKSLKIEKARVNKDVAVIGGGIAGIHASLLLAKMKFKVNLIEKETVIGGNMAKLVKTFPTDDCAMCTLSPKLDEVAKNKNIRLMAYSEVQDVEKLPEGLRIKVLRKARYVDEQKCTGCGKCAEVCPVDIYNEYNQGLFSTKKAAYKDFAAAAPNLYTIQKRQMAPCKAACPVNQSAQGYLALVAEKRYEEAFNVVCRDNPLPSVCGRVCDHVCETECTRNDVDEPIAIRGVKRFLADYAREHHIRPTMPLVEMKNKRVAVIGGGPAGLGCAHSLHRLGYDVSIFEAMPELGGMLRYGIPEYRLPQNVLDWEIQGILDLGIKAYTNKKLGRDIDLDSLVSEGFDAVFLGMGAWKDYALGVDGEDLSGGYTGIDFLSKIGRGESVPIGRRCAVIGGGNTAIDCARTLIRLGAEEVSIIYRRTRAEMPAIEEEIDAAAHEGVKFHFLAAPVRFLGDPEKRMTHLEYIKMELGEPDDSGRRRPIPIEGTETRMELDTLVTATGQGPDLAFMGDRVKLNVNRRGLIETLESSTSTGLEKIFAGGDVTTGPATVIGAVAKGQLAAEEIDCYLNQKAYPGKAQPYQRMDYNRREIIQSKEGYYEKAPRMNMPEIPLAERNDFTEVETGFTEEMAVAEAKRCLQCGDCSDCRVCEIACEANAIDHFQKDITETIEVGAVIVATGFKEYDPSGLHYGYGKYPDVITQLQFARMLDLVGPTNGEVLRAGNRKPAKKIVMVQCVGSRAAEQGIEGGHPYCSRVCCMVAIKHAGMVKKYFNPEAEIYICYIDIRAFGKGYEEYFEAVKGMGVKFIRGLPGSVLKDKDTGKLRVTVEDANTSALLEIQADLVILSSATEPAENSDLMRKLNITMDESGFIKEFHPKIRPTDTMVKNIFVCGAAQGPKDIPDTIAQAGSAASSAAAYLGDGYVWLNPMISTVNASLCRACGRCEEGCDFGAIKVDAAKLCACVEAGMCEGCGKCAVLCPTGAASLHSGTDEQIGALIDGLKLEKAK